MQVISTSLTKAHSAVTTSYITRKDVTHPAMLICTTLRHLKQLVKSLMILRSTKCVSERPTGKSSAQKKSSSRLILIPPQSLKIWQKQAEKSWLSMENQEDYLLTSTREKLLATPLLIKNLHFKKQALDYSLLEIEHQNLNIVRGTLFLRLRRLSMRKSLNSQVTVDTEWRKGKLPRLKGRIIRWGRAVL